LANLFFKGSFKLEMVKTMATTLEKQRPRSAGTRAVLLNRLRAIRKASIARACRLVQQNVFLDF
jgi:hypothetical protein